MLWKGLFRLWVVVSVIGVPIVTVLLAQQDFETWHKIDKPAYEYCFSLLDQSPSNAAVKTCERQHGLDKSIFERENTTAARYWLTGLFLVFVMDVAATLALAAFLGSLIWVKRGFLPV